ncbi:MULTISPECIES: fused isobutyryl-CoA mutase/GTPase IcmF [Brevibacillus]|jgi:methylmalonyl-CoA mutase|uniref:Fused isobutyryl-CoA mutase n=1 Tax=Brevibacillus parabrevis TaxID=54914 RepID=A0A4Y3PA30_BREPA|nr:MULTISPECIES: fused isobutyryl-CoA mutase/GTPase IcmF [Brevibacillus]MDH6350997.1 methylmalonyl-CoA mutase [Brevibacillus sp. 1238]MDR4997758.1 methylmalonyl-CoA mutase family protein [Brevibacillus parabrevis]MED2256053.1 methylmalonyl-CoA mutase family protein [Brevibacillus parabrevis]NRQ53350.1 methylmalonyl-CoA mutase family protein [Brevibacillus sp. HD1.4A]RNB97238.1 methylmalonyl-CoA mutase [Brevibacillus parabrevis]
METEVYRPQNKVRFVTAASLYDGHDASINIMRRILQSSGVEVIHLGHNRSVDDIVTAAIQEDVQGIAISSYQGGHVEYFKYVIDLLRERGAEHIRVFGGGGGVIVPREIRELEEYGVCKIYSPDDGRRLGLQGMINDMIRNSDFPTVKQLEDEVKGLREQNHKAVARLISVAEYAVDQPEWKEPLQASVLEAPESIPVLGITGTGGAGKSSLTDELVRRFIRTYPEKTVAILSVDPSKQKSGGALLGDRIRMNANNTPRVYMRSLATRKSGMELSAALKDAIQVTRAAQFDLIIVETSGIGQGDAQVTEVCDVSMYVMTSEFGAPSQLEKIDMLDFADVIAINKFERKGSEDALREVRKQYRRNHQLFDLPDEQVPVYGTIASQFNDPGTNVLFAALMHKIVQKTNVDWSVENLDTTPVKIHKTSLIPTERINYLQEIANTVRQYQAYTDEQSAIARKLYQLHGAKETLLAAKDEAVTELIAVLDKQIKLFEEKLHPECRKVLDNWPKLKEAYRQDQFVTRIRDKEIVTKLFSESLSGTRISKVAVPDFHDWGEILKWSLKENVPGEFPYTAGVFPFKREGEDPKRQFAGEGTPERTNRRFHFLSQNDEAKRLSTAFDSVTLYGEDPDYRPDIYGKIGTSGVSICTLDDMKKLYAGFDLCAPSTSVSMTINGPAPMILAMFMNTAIEQQIEKFVQKEGRQPTEEEAKQIKAYTLSTVRGTVQADILKEDQGQNTCIFSTEFALRMMGDIQQYFIDQKVRNYYSVSISGYHIAEAGANPITQLAFTLANGFTYVEYYLSRGMHIDDFAPNLSFFFSNGLDPEYTVIGRVARRIWATVMKNRYGGNERSQKLKYHIQTSGRSLHAQEMDFNDIRTTLQALIAIYDNCNSLHTNAYDEAITTPTENSVRRAMAIQMIINKEMGLAKNENPLQGAFIIEELTDLVEESVMQEFERISSRGGVLGAMETQYQRGKIQDESMYYEMKKHTGELPIIGVNTFINPNASEDDYEIELARATEEEKEQQIINLRAFQERHRDVAPQALRRLQEVAMAGENIFAELMETVKVASLGQISAALYEVGGQYRRNM